ncbi:hypothetical protein PMIN04_004080 [Paraphaeosphaeria minitans]
MAVRLVPTKASRSKSVLIVWPQLHRRLFSSLEHLQAVGVTCPSPGHGSTRTHGLIIFCIYSGRTSAWHSASFVNMALAAVAVFGTGEYADFLERQYRPNCPTSARRQCATGVGSTHLGVGSIPSGGYTMYLPTVK